MAQDRFATNAVGDRAPSLRLHPIRCRYGATPGESSAVINFTPYCPGVPKTAHFFAELSRVFLAKTQKLPMITRKDAVDATVSTGPLVGCSVNVPLGKLSANISGPGELCRMLSKIVSIDRFPKENLRCGSQN